MFTSCTLIASLLLSSASTTVQPINDWPNWRGPEHTGISTETEWFASGVELWKRNVGRGYSSFAIADGRLFTAGYDEVKGEDVITALDAMIGEVVWTHRYPAEIWNRAHKGGTLSTPTVHGKHVITCNREGNMFCFNAADGKIVWQKQLKEVYSLDYPTWGFAASPLIVDNTIIMNVGSVIAFDAGTGEEVWRSEKNYGDAYSTPTPFQLSIGTQALAVFNQTGLVVLDQSTGKEIASQEWRNRPNVNAASPIVVGNDQVFISSGYNRGCAMIEVSPEGESNILWENKDMRNKMSGCVLINDHLFGFDESMLKCLDLDGNEMWRQRGLGMGTIMASEDGRLIINSSKGELIVAKATPDGYEELSRMKVLDGGEYWTTPVLANSIIYTRNSTGDLVATDHRNRK